MRGGWPGAPTWSSRATSRSLPRAPPSSPNGPPPRRPGPLSPASASSPLRHLWFASDGPVGQGVYAGLWRERFGEEPPAARGDVRRNEKLMRRRRPYDTPAAWVHGQWFFAHDRLAQIGERLDSLGWKAAA